MKTSAAKINVLSSLGELDNQEPRICILPRVPLNLSNQTE
jgi:hypothetical protein